MACKLKEAQDLLGELLNDISSNSNKGISSVRDSLADAQEVVESKVKVVQSTTEGVNKLKWYKNANTLTFTDGSTSTQINTMKELKELADDYHNVMVEQHGIPWNDYDKHKEWFDTLYKQIDDAGIPFRPVTVQLSKYTTDDILGYADADTGTITLSTTKVTDAYPIKVVLHEYAHMITLSELSEHPTLQKRARQIMATVLDKSPELAKEYGFTNEKEFIAEVISSPRLQTQLSKISSDNKDGLVAPIKKIFRALLDKMSNKNKSALTDSLEVVLELTKSKDKTHNQTIPDVLGTSKVDKLKYWSDKFSQYIVGSSIDIQRSNGGKYRAEITATELQADGYLTVTGKKGNKEYSYIVNPHTGKDKAGNTIPILENGYKRLGSGPTTDTDTTTEELDRLQFDVGTQAHIIFQGHLQEDIEAGTFNTQDKDDAQYVANLNNIVQEYAEVFKDADKVVDYTLLERLGEEATDNIRGDAEPDNNKMRLLLGNTRFQSESEVFAHELQHVLIHNAIEVSPRLRQAITLFKNELRDKIDYTVFLDGLEDVTGADVDTAKAMYDYAFNNETFPESEFLAYVTTNKALYKATQGMEFTDKLFNVVEKQRGKDRAKGQRQGILDVFGEILNKIYSMFRFGGNKVQPIGMTLLRDALRIAADSSDREVKDPETLLGKSIDLLERADTKTQEVIDKLNGAKKKVTKNIDVKTESGTKVLVDRLWQIKGLSNAKSFMLQNNLFSSVWRDTTDDGVGTFYDMFRAANTLKKDVVDMKHAVYGVMVNTYKMNTLSQGERQAVKRVLLDTDYRAIGSMAEVMVYLDNPDALEVDAVALSEEFSKEELRDIEGLAGKLVNSVGTEADGYMNAAAILSAHRKTKISNMEEDIAKADKLASMLAMINMSAEDKTLTIKAVNKNPEGVHRAMNFYYTQMDMVLDKALNGNKVMAEKGVKQDHYEGNKQFSFVREEDVKKLESRSVKVVGKHAELSRIAGEPIMVMIGENPATAYTEGMLNVIQMKSEGTSLRSVLGSLFPDETPAEINKRLKIEVAAEKEDAGEFGYLIPERNYDKSIQDYLVRMPQKIKEQLLGLDNDIAHTIAHTASNITHREEAIMANTAGVKFLMEFYETHKRNKEFNFIEVRPTSEDEKLSGKEYEHADKWHKIPKYLQYSLKRQYGGNKIMVEESMLTDYFGYKDVSITDVGVLNKTGKRKDTVRKVEKGIQEVAGRWAKVIVTLTPSTIQGNMVSNALVTMQHTKDKNPATYLGNFARKWELMNQYGEAKKRLVEHKIRKDAGEDIKDSTIRGLERALERNPMHELIVDGQYTNLLEDIDAGLFQNTGEMAQKIEKQFDKIKDKKKKANVKEVFDTLYMNNDSKYYKKIQKLTTYADLINRSIVHDDNMARGQDRRKSLRYVDKLFVNYSYLDNRIIKYLNDVLFVKFTKFFGRSLGAMVAMGKRKPVTMFFVEAVQKMVGVDLETPMDQYYNPIDVLINKVVWDQPGSVFEAILTPPPAAAVL